MSSCFETALSVPPQHERIFEIHYKKIGSQKLGSVNQKYEALNRLKIVVRYARSHPSPFVKTSEDC